MWKKTVDQSMSSFGHFASLLLPNPSLFKLKKKRSFRYMWYWISVNNQISKWIIKQQKLSDERALPQTAVCHETMIEPCAQVHLKYNLYVEQKWNAMIHILLRFIPIHTSSLILCSFKEGISPSQGLPPTAKQCAVNSSLTKLPNCQNEPTPRNATGH